MNVTIEQKVERWLDFAAFNDTLKEEKFEHDNWCRPDHTCKTTACVAGWGAIRYDEKTKKWLEANFDLQRNLVKGSSFIVNKQFARTQRYREVRDIIYGAEPDWPNVGQEVLFLTFEQRGSLFLPNSKFWSDYKCTLSNEEYVKFNVGPKHIALVFRYLAARKGKLPKRFNPKTMQRYIDNKAAA